MANDSDTDVLLTELGAALRDTEMGTKYTGLYSMEGTLDGYFGPNGDEEMTRALWGLSWDGLKKKGQEFWERVSPQLHTAFCDPKSAYSKELAGLLKAGETGITAALAGLIIQAAAGLFPALAASAVAFFLAKLILRLFVTNAYELACDTWAQTLK